MDANTETGIEPATGLRVAHDADLADADPIEAAWLRVYDGLPPYSPGGRTLRATAKRDVANTAADTAVGVGGSVLHIGWDGEGSTGRHGIGLVLWVPDMPAAAEVVSESEKAAGAWEAFIGKKLGDPAASFTVVAKAAAAAGGVTVSDLPCYQTVTSPLPAIAEDVLALVDYEIHETVHADLDHEHVDEFLSHMIDGEDDTLLGAFNRMGDVKSVPHDVTDGERARILDALPEPHRERIARAMDEALAAVHCTDGTCMAYMRTRRQTGFAHRASWYDPAEGRRLQANVGDVFVIACPEKPQLLPAQARKKRPGAEYPFRLPGPQGIRAKFAIVSRR